MKNIVVVGGGHAAAQFCASIVEKKLGHIITLVTEEGCFPYQRPPLSKTYIKDAQPTPVWLRPASFYTENNINTYFNSRATAIDRERKLLQLSTGEILAYDILVLATGTRARPLPSMDAARYSNVFMLRNIEDAHSLRDKISVAENVLVIGGGFIGLEIAATSRSLGKNVVVAEAAPRLLGRSVAKEVSDYLLCKHRSNGVVVLLEAAIERVAKAAGTVTAVWINGTRYVTDVVVVGVGALPNTELAKEAGLACDNGVVVNELMQTSDPTIYAIGDCANFPYFTFNSRLRLESVQNANDQARCAAGVICGEANPYRTLPWFWSEQGDVRVQIAGVPRGEDERVVRGDPSEHKFSVLYFDNGMLTCVESVNVPADHIAARKLIASRAVVDRELAKNPIQALKDLAVAME